MNAQLFYLRSELVVRHNPTCPSVRNIDVLHHVHDFDVPSIGFQKIHEIIMKLINGKNRLSKAFAMVC